MLPVQCVLRGDPDPDDPEFFEVVADAVAVLNQAGFRFALEEEEERDGAVSLHWLDADEIASITLLKERDAGMCSLSLWAGKGSDLKRMIGILEDRLDIVTLHELQSRGRKGVFRDPAVLIKIATAAGHQPDSDSVDILRKGLESRYPHVRLHAAWAMGITAWPAFILDLERRLKQEPDEEVRELAEHALVGCRREEARASQRR